MAVLLVGAVARQATGATARMQSLVDAAPPRRGRFAPASGSFDPRLAEALARWKEE